MTEVNAPVVDAEVNAPVVDAGVNAPVVDALRNMNEGIPERSGLDAETFMLVRIAALASTGAPPASYLLNLEAAPEVGLTLEQVQGVLIAVAPVVGSARVASAGSSMDEAFGLQRSSVDHSRAGGERSDR